MTSLDLEIRMRKYYDRLHHMLQQRYKTTRVETILRASSKCANDKLIQDKEQQEDRLQTAIIDNSVRISCSRH